MVAALALISELIPEFILALIFSPRIFTGNHQLQWTDMSPS